MNRLTNVECFHSGGGFISYYAQFNGEVWLAGDLSEWFGSYDMPKVIVDDDFLDNGVPYENHVKIPSVPYPTWQEILDSLKGTDMYDDACYQIERSHNLRDLCMYDDVYTEERYAPHSVPSIGDSVRLETIAEFIEVFEDFLDEKGIDIPNDEKAEDPDASTIYGTDYGNLSDRIEKLLIRYGILKGE